MITKDAFVGIMNAMRDYNDGLTKLEDNLGAVFEGNWMVKVIDNILNALSDELEEGVLDYLDDSFIYTFAFTCDWGRDEDATHVKINGCYYNLDSAEKLYDLLLTLRKNQR